MPRGHRTTGLWHRLRVSRAPCVPSRLPTKKRRPPGRLSALYESTLLLAAALEVGIRDPGIGLLDELPIGHDLLGEYLLRIEHLFEERILGRLLGIHLLRRGHEGRVIV